MAEFPVTKPEFIVPSCVNLSTYIQGMSDYEIFCYFSQLIQQWAKEWADMQTGWISQQEAFESFKTYVNGKISEFQNWFDNLDVQTEINNKLDEMLADGSLNTIIGVYLFSRVELDNYSGQVSENQYWDTALKSAASDCATYNVPLHITPGKHYKFRFPVSLSDITIFSETLSYFDFSDANGTEQAFTISGNNSVIKSLAIINTNNFNGFAVKASYLANRASIENLFISNCNNGLWIERSWYCPVNTARIVGNTSSPQGIGLRLGDSSNAQSGVNGINFSNIQINYFETGMELVSNVNINSTQFSGITIENIMGSAIVPNSYGNVGFSGLYCENLKGETNVLMSQPTTYITLSNVVVRANNATSLAPDNSYRVVLLDRLFNPQELSIDCFTTTYYSSLQNLSSRTYSHNMVSSSTRFHKDAGNSTVTITLPSSLYNTAYMCVLKIVPASALSSSPPGAYAVLLYDRNYGKYTPLVYGTTENDTDSHLITFSGNTGTLNIKFGGSFAQLEMNVYVEFVNPANLMV